MMNLVCINPHTLGIHGSCTRYPDNKCCVCPGPKVLIEIKTIDSILNLLKIDGSGTKQKVIKMLSSYGTKAIKESGNYPGSDQDV